MVLAFAALAAGAAPRAHAQTGGTTGTTPATGSLAAGDFFLAIQKGDQPGTNLNAANQARFLDHASCECKRDVLLRALLYPAAVGKAATVPGTASVSMYLGNQCNTTVGLPNCGAPLKVMTFSEFKLNGMTVATTVDEIAKVRGVVSGTTGSGGDSGAGGAGGAAGAGGTAGTSGSGGTSGSTDPCDTTITQTMWLLVETTPGLFDVASASLALGYDGTPPPTPAKLNVAPANEALIATWEAVDQTVTNDLAGYQVFCARGNQHSVFGSGTFETQIDTCHDEATDLSTTALEDRNTHYLCSDFLSTSTTSYRIKVLQNDIPYLVGVAAVDLRGNPSLVVPFAQVKPMQTYDFYYSYRTGDPQGEATGGYCAVVAPPSRRDLFGVAAISVCLALVAWRRGRGRAQSTGQRGRR